MNSVITIYVVSDSIGETGELIARAAIRQFVNDNYEIKKYPYINDETKIDEIFEEAKENTSIVLYTTVLEKNRDYIIKKGNESNIKTVDIMTAPLKAIEDLLGYPPKRESGLIRRLDENYFQKVEAIEFAVRYDDGKDPGGIIKADICLIGISRTSKTPLSMYLAHKNYKVANIPLVPEVLPPKEIFDKDKKRIIGLIANSNKLNEIRLERLKALGLDGTASYANMDRINLELAYSRDIMEKIGCFVIDVSHKAIEETAGIIMEHMQQNFN